MRFFILVALLLTVATTERVNAKDPRTACYQGCVDRYYNNTPIRTMPLDNPNRAALAAATVPLVEACNERCRESPDPAPLPAAGNSPCEAESQKMWELKAEADSIPGDNHHLNAKRQATRAFEKQMKRSMDCSRAEQQYAPTDPFWTAWRAHQD